MGTVNIDFETRSVVPISVGASKYSKHAAIMCIAYMIDGGDVKAWWPGLPEPTDLLDAVRAGYVAKAFNANFEKCIWQNCMVPKYGWPKVDVRQWQCTMAEALAAGLPSSLDECAKALNLDVTKDSEGRRIMLKMTKPRKARKAEVKDFEAKGQKVPVLWHNDPEDFNRLVAYCKQDVVVEAKIATRIRRLSSRELQVFHFDSIVNERGVQIDVDLARAAVELWGQHCKALEQELYRITFGGIESVGMVARIVDLLCKLGCYVPGLAKGTVTEALSWSHIGRTARRVLEIRQELGMSSIKKFQAMVDCADADGRVRGAIQYHGARTGRYAGRLIQPQNFARGEIKCKEADALTKQAEEFKKQGNIDAYHKWMAKAEAEFNKFVEDLVSSVKSNNDYALCELSELPIAKSLSGMLRSAITAGPGKKLVVCDFASVEARGVAWAAGEQWMVDAFAKDADIYKEMAAGVFKVKADDVDKHQRFIGKQLVLGCSYCLGAEGFQFNLRNQFGVELDLDFCKECVDGYRSSCPNIKRFWYKLENAMVNAVKAGGIHKAGPYSFYVKGDWLYMRMPCGRDISYYKPELRPGKYGPQVSYIGTDVTGKPIRELTYSGKICENATQAVCRDLLVEAMSRLEKAGYQVILTVHDEIVCEVDENFGSAEEMKEIMCQVPDWAKGFPIGGEAWQGFRYRK